MKLVSDLTQACEDTAGDTTAQSLEVVVNRPHNAAPGSVISAPHSVLFLEPVSDYEQLRELFYNPESYGYTDLPHRLNQYFIPSYRSNPFTDAAQAEVEDTPYTGLTGELSQDKLETEQKA